MRKIFYYLFITVITVICLTGSIYAAQLTSHPVLSPKNGLFTCVVTNVGKRTLDVTVEHIGSNGDVLESVVLQLGALETKFAEKIITFDEEVQPQVCRFIFKGSKKKVRATVCIKKSSKRFCDMVLPVQ